MSVLALPLLALLVLTPGPSSVQEVLAAHPADSLVGPLGRFETARRAAAAAEAAVALGYLHYARGEYRQAADAFVRAVPHSEPARRSEVRYWAGLSWLGAGEVRQARSAFEAAARSGSPRRPEALLGLALCWQAGHRPERALETLQILLGDDPGEAGPAALERFALLAARLDRPEAARRARERLTRDYPRSIEALRAGQPPAVVPAPAIRAPSHRPTAAPGRAAPRVPPPPAAMKVSLAVQIGAYRDEARARVLADSARRAGFHPVRIAIRQDAGAALYGVCVGVYATAEDARSAGERLARALGVGWRVVPVP